MAPGLPAVRGDAARLLHLLENLVSNAIKYTPAGGKVTAGADVRGPDGQVLLEVRDTGIGIPAGGAAAALHGVLPRGKRQGV